MHVLTPTVNEEFNFGILFLFGFCVSCESDCVFGIFRRSTRVCLGLLMLFCIRGSMLTSVSSEIHCRVLLVSSSCKFLLIVKSLMSLLISFNAEYSFVVY